MSNSRDGVIYHDNLASKWSERYSGVGFQKRMHLFEEILSQQVNDREFWLDAGCGTGVLSKILIDKGANVLGIDASMPMVMEARNNVSDYTNKNCVEFRHIKTVEELDIPDNSVDGILCSSVLEYLDEPELALEEFQRIVRLGGVLVLSVPNKRSLVRIGQKFIRIFGKLIGKDIAPYLSVSKNEYSKEEFQKLLIKYGLKCIDYVAFDPIFNKNCFSRFKSLHVFIVQST